MGMYPGYQRFFLACDNWVVTIKTWPNQTRCVKSLLHLGEGEWTWMQTFVCKNMIKESRAVSSDWDFAEFFFDLPTFVYYKFNPLLPCIFQILIKVNNVIQVYGMSSQLSWEVLLGILGGGVPPGSLNPDPISDQKISFFTPVKFRPGH